MCRCFGGSGVTETGDIVSFKRRFTTSLAFCVLVGYASTQPVEVYISTNKNRILYKLAYGSSPIASLPLSKFPFSGLFYRGGVLFPGLLNAPLSRFDRPA